MSPRCFPPQPEFGRGRTAERRVWEVLRGQLPDDAALLHSVGMVARAAEPETAPLTGAGLESLLEVLEGQLPGQTSLLSWAEENEAYVDQLTRDQAKVARILRQQRRLKVIGGAGTGKTWLALEHARLLAAGGER